MASYYAEEVAMRDEQAADNDAMRGTMLGAATGARLRLLIFAAVFR